METNQIEEDDDWNIRYLEVDLEEVFEDEVLGNLADPITDDQRQLLRFAFLHGAYSVALPAMHLPEEAPMEVVTSDMEEICDDCFDGIFGTDPDLLNGFFAYTRDAYTEGQMERASVNNCAARDLSEWAGEWGRQHKVVSTPKALKPSYELGVAFIGSFVPSPEYVERALDGGSEPTP